MNDIKLTRFGIGYEAPIGDRATLFCTAESDRFAVHVQNDEGKLIISEAVLLKIDDTRLIHQLRHAWKTFLVLRNCPTPEHVFEICKECLQTYSAGPALISIWKPE